MRGNPEEINHANACPSEGWEHQDRWIRREATFLVEVHHRTVDRGATGMGGPHRWAVYVYIYPNHPHFAAFSGDRMFQDAATVIPLHGGVSFLRWHTDRAGKPTSVQVGADYGHLHDEMFSFVEPDHAEAVFADANELYEWMRAKARSEEEVRDAR